MEKSSPDSRPPATVSSISTGPFEMLFGRVLVAEDDPLNQHLVLRMLEKHGLKGTVVDNGNSAVEVALGQPWDVVLMDCQMPGMDGYQATKAIRARLAGRRLPIIALTANSEPEDRAACIAAGMDDFLAKPVRRPELHACLKKWLGPAPAAGKASGGAA